MKFSAFPPRRRLAIWGSILALLCFGAPQLSRENFLSDGGRLDQPIALPGFPDGAANWIGGEPMTVGEMHGRVWVLKVWTFGCVNCVRSIAFVNGLSERYEGRVGVLGIHSPEFDWERNLENMEATMRKHGVNYPSYVDESLDYFFALEAPAWPAFYVVDQTGFIRGSWFGEVHDGTMRAREIDSLIEELLQVAHAE
ncbi:MAG: thiol-disulfide isomerase/thioredoxin [Planctomycetota bacterium]|jgi:thiol-disulfide isomerase/thioredoxin